MKLWIGSFKSSSTQVSRPFSHLKLGDASGAVSLTRSLSREHPSWNVWYSPSQWPTSCGTVSLRL